MPESLTPDSANLMYVESLYELYMQDPGSVSPEWRREFESWNHHAHDEAVAGNGNGTLTSHTPNGSNGAALRLESFRTQPRFKPRSIFNPPAGIRGTGQGSLSSDSLSSLQFRVDQLVRNYRVRGHTAAKIDPLGSERPVSDELDPAYYGITEADMDQKFHSQVIPDDARHSLREIVSHLRETYCQNIGVQFMHIDNLKVREWLQSRMESTQNKIEMSRKEQLRTLTRLTDAVIFEQFIQSKFIGAKSFSLEGAESLIPLMDKTFEKAGEQGIREVVIGMAHRGRLNVLANIMGKSPQQIFREFEDRDPELYIGGGDVKYHLGYSGDWTTSTGKSIHLSLCFNPSHLEFVNTVAMGRMRAKQDRSELSSRGEGGMVMLIHGDAAFAGEGIIQETLNLSELGGYSVGGTLHVIVNNQLGFTTSPSDSRSSRYATDVAKMLQIPIFHVNGESPEAVAQAIHLAMEFRIQFKRDVVIDMYCYRRRGHNESDEPSYTHPLMYKAIEKRPTVREAYLGSLLKLGQITQEDADRIAKRRTEHLEKELTAARSDDYIVKPQTLAGVWTPFKGGRDRDVPDPDTGVDKKVLSELLASLTQTPDDFEVHPKLQRWLRNRYEQSTGERALDWASAESLAFATLLTNKTSIRLSGQDSQRGTFSQRHAVLHDHRTDQQYCPLNHLSDDQAHFEVLNSPLSETGVLGFEYGYSLDSPDALVLWEAQFGDFVNVAQPIIDQFIASAEDKWHRLSGIVMLLPHGFEGQGPEHSSARLERFLAMGAEDNIQVVQPSTPAQFFHVLRRQALRPWRKPLIVMTPKSLLRHPRCVSTLDDLSKGYFQRVLPDEMKLKRKDVKRILMCSGRIYYDLVERREQLERKDIAIIRLEQYYPFPTSQMQKVLKAYDPKTELVWVQDEPKNMGAWPFLKSLSYHFSFEGPRMRSVARAVSSSPATGSRAAHLIEQEELMTKAFEPIT